jgi:peroxiredoxin Q/BCP
MLKQGDRAPTFSLPSDTGETIALGDFKGTPVVLYFYPKDDTSGCTVEACEFRDRWKDVRKAGAVILGVSPDDTASHRKFRTKYDLPFPLLADEGHQLAEKYGAWGEKSMYGRKYQGILRTTFLIGGDGKIVRVFQKVKPKGHAAEVLAALNEE